MAKGFWANGAPEALADTIGATLVVTGSLCLFALAQHRPTSQAPVLAGSARAAYAAVMLQAPVLLSLEIAGRSVDLPPLVEAVLVGTLAVAASFGLGWVLVRHTPLARSSESAGGSSPGRNVGGQQVPGRPAPPPGNQTDQGDGKECNPMSPSNVAAYGDVQHSLVKSCELTKQIDEQEQRTPTEVPRQEASASRLPSARSWHKAGSLRPTCASLRFRRSEACGRLRHGQDSRRERTKMPCQADV